MIRTYTRRAPECELIEGVEKCCRLCLGGEPSVPIYGSTGICSLLATRIMLVVGLEISRDTFLPNSICKECHRQIEKCYSFRKMCEVAYQKLKMHLQAAKMKEANELHNETNKRTSLLRKCLENEVQDHGNNIKSELEKNTANVPAVESLKTQLENIANLDNVDLVLVINENNVQLLGDSQIDQNKVMELCGSGVQETVTQGPPKHPQQSIQRSLHQSIQERQQHSIQEIPQQTIQETPLQTIQETSHQPIQESQHQSIQESQQQSIQETQFQTIQETQQQSIQEIPLQSIQQSLQQSVQKCQQQSIQESSQPTIQGIQQQYILGTPQQSIQETQHQSIQESQQQSIQESIQESISVFITTELVESDMLSVEDGDKLVLNKEVDMVLELLAGDGSLLTLDVLEEDEEVEQTVPKEPAIMLDSELKAATANGLTVTMPSGDASAPKAKRKAKSHTEQLHTCPSCSKQFTRRGEMERHWRVHSGERPHRCRHCARAFAQRSVCARHELTHDEIRPFQCSECPKSFTQRGSLNAHARTHQPPAARPLLLHACALCPKMFLYGSGLSRHMKMHAGHLFSCASCDRAFNDKSSLRRHTAKHRRADT